MSDTLVVDETKKAVYTPYLDYTMVTSSSIYDCSIKTPRRKLPYWLKVEIEEKETNASQRNPCY